jgi:hypothetical protein
MEYISISTIEMKYKINTKQYISHNYLWPHKLYKGKVWDWTLHANMSQTLTQQHIIKIWVNRLLPPAK